MNLLPAKIIAPLIRSLTAAWAPVVPVAVLPPSTAKPRMTMCVLFFTRKPDERTLAPVVRSWSLLPVPMRVRSARLVILIPASPPSL